MPEQAPVVVTDAPPPHPIHLVVSDDLHRRRPTVFCRILLVIPAYIVVSVLGYAARVVIFLAWLSAPPSFADEWRLLDRDSHGRLPLGSRTVPRRPSLAYRAAKGSFLLGRDDPLGEGSLLPYMTGHPAGGAEADSLVAPWRRPASSLPPVETDADPLVMYLVVRRRTSRSFAELATAAAIATRRCAHRYREDDRWRDGFDDWWRHSFRKVCLRAEAREWEDVRALDHERVGDVACLPPVRRSARDRVLVRMRVLSDEGGPLPELGDTVPDALTLVVATDLGMSSGKTFAQIGHASLMADLDRALDPDLDVRVVGAGGEKWSQLAGSAAIIVRDGGLTEIAEGSETVLVLPWQEPRSG